jgi:hypothetical protein
MKETQMPRKQPKPKPKPRLVDPSPQRLPPFGTLTPAYGRDYRTSADVLKDWNANKDFVLNNPHGQTYINKIDAENYGGTSFQFRYRKIEEVGMLTRQSDGTWTVTADDFDL